MSNSELPQHKKREYLISVSTLKRSYAKENWIELVTGLMNNLNPFAGSAISPITTSYDSVVTLEEVVEKNQILIIATQSR